MKSILDIKKRLISNTFFLPRWYAIFLNPYFICRRWLFTAVRSFARSLQNDSRILDVGCGNKPYRNSFKTPHYTGIDIPGGGHTDEEKRADKYYDGSSIPYPDSTFDALICTQVLEHADKPEILITEFHRVLNSGGKLLITMPFIYPEHEQPHDYRRYTRFELQRILKKSNFQDIRIMPSSGAFATIAQLLSIKIFESITIRASVLKLIISFLILAPIQILGLTLDLIFRNNGPTLDYIVTAIK
jgi:SAM-dependent methyltransferase